MINQKINQKIKDLWTRYYGSSDEVYAPLFYNDFKTNSLLFIGMNPSFSERAFKTIFKGTEHEGMDPISFFKWSNISSNDDLIDQCAMMDKQAFTNYSLYFGRPIAMSKAVGLPWEHLDLFLYRETSQSSFMQRIHDGKELNQFALDQLAVFEDALAQVQPKCIVVSNAFGSELFRSQFADDLKWDDDRGFHWFKNSTPIFFSSMLSGQRSLDRWSYERLVWHVDQSIK